jgi:acetyl esterase/lipase
MRRVKPISIGLLIALACMMSSCAVEPPPVVASVMYHGALSTPTAPTPATPTALLPSTPTYQPTPDLSTPTLSPLLDKKLEINVVTDIPYTSERKLDVYSPVTPGDWPVVVVLHGGDLTKSAVQGISKAIAQNGAVVFTPTYRSGQPYPPSDRVLGGIEDAACAVRFARAEAEQYGTKNSARLVLAGHSAGGAIGLTVMLAGDDFKGDCLVKEGSALPDAFVGLDGAYDILPLVSQDALERAPLEEWKKFTPFTYVDREPIREGVSFYILCGSEEELRQMGLRMYQALQTAGYRAYLAFLPGVDHMSMASAGNKQVLSTIVEAIQAQK